MSEVTADGICPLQQWIFDAGTGSAAARQLRVQSGHSEPPVRVMFYGESGEEVISAGADSTVRVFATFKTDGTFKNLGRAAYNRKKVKKMTKKQRYNDDGGGGGGGEDAGGASRFSDMYERQIMPPISDMAGGETSHHFNPSCSTL
jgi:hypothetical protein